MKKPDQLSFGYFDVKAPRQGTHTSRVKKINIDDKSEVARLNVQKDKKVDARESRLIFYSNLAAHSQPTFRVQRQRSMRENNLNEATDMDSDEFFKDLAVELPGKRSVFHDNQFKLIRSRVARIKIAVNSMHEWLKKIYTRCARSFVKNRKKIMTLVGIVFLAVAVSLLTNYLFFKPAPQPAPIQQSAPASQTSGEWEKSKLEWECALARYQASQNNTTIDAEKEQICAKAGQ